MGVRYLAWDWAELGVVRGRGGQPWGRACAGWVFSGGLWQGGMFIPTFFGTPFPLSNNTLGVRKDWRHAVPAQVSRFVVQRQTGEGDDDDGRSGYWIRRIRVHRPPPPLLDVPMYTMHAHHKNPSACRKHCSTPYQCGVTLQRTRAQQRRFSKNGSGSVTNQHFLTPTCTQIPHSTLVHRYYFVVVVVVFLLVEPYLCPP